MSRNWLSFNQKTEVAGFLKEHHANGMSAEQLAKKATEEFGYEVTTSNIHGLLKSLGLKTAYTRSITREESIVALSSVVTSLVRGITVNPDDLEVLLKIVQDR